MTKTLEERKAEAAKACNEAWKAWRETDKAWDEANEAYRAIIKELEEEGK